MRESYDRLKRLIGDTTGWPSEQHIGGAIAAIVHTAYHLGEIRQALCTVKPWPAREMVFNVQAE